MKTEIHNKEATEKAGEFQDTNCPGLLYIIVIEDSEPLEEI